MKCFQNILMIAPPADGADAALERPVALAQACGAAMSVVDVLSNAAAPRVETAAEATTSAGRAGREEQLMHLVEPFKGRGVNIVSRVLAGKPVPEIIRQIELYGHDLVVVPAAAQRPVRGKLVGVPIVPLMRRCPCPVWVLKPTQMLHGGVLVAANPGSVEDQDGALSHSLIRLAACFSRAVGSPLSVLHVWHLIGESQIRHPLVGARSEQIASLLDKAYKRATFHMEQLLDRIDLRDSKYELYVEEGHQPAKAIAEFALRRQIETVIMGMMGHSGIAGFLFGNSAEEVLHGVPCSVMTLRAGCSFPPVRSDEGLLGA